MSNKLNRMPVLINLMSVCCLSVVIVFLRQAYAWSPASNSWKHARQDSEGTIFITYFHSPCFVTIVRLQGKKLQNKSLCLKSSKLKEKKLAV